MFVWGLESEDRRLFDSRPVFSISIEREMLWMRYLYLKREPPKWFYETNKTVCLLPSS